MIIFYLLSSTCWFFRNDQRPLPTVRELVWFGHFRTVSSAAFVDRSAPGSPVKSSDQNSIASKTISRSLALRPKTYWSWQILLAALQLAGDRNCKWRDRMQTLRVAKKQISAELAHQNVSDKGGRIGPNVSGSDATRQQKWTFFFVLFFFQTETCKEFSECRLIPEPTPLSFQGPKAHLELARVAPCGHRSRWGIGISASACVSYCWQWHRATRAKADAAKRVK